MSSRSRSRIILALETVFLKYLIREKVFLKENKNTLRLLCKKYAAAIHIPKTLVTFYTIEDAVAYAKKCKGLRVWGKDKYKIDKKTKTCCFYVGTMSSMVMTLRYLSVRKLERCYYEIIHVSGDNLQSETGTRAYLDLEYDRNISTHTIPDSSVISEVVRDFIPYLRSELESYMKDHMKDRLSGDTEDTGDTGNIHIKSAVLTAHSDQKFSAHVIFRVYIDNVEVMFQSVYCVGAIFRKWEYAREEKDPYYYHCQSSGKKSFIADCGVYTKRRQFRMLNNTKLGQNRYLVSSNDKMEYVGAAIQDHDFGTSRKFDVNPPVLISVTEADGREAVQTSSLWGDFISIHTLKRGPQVLGSITRTDGSKRLKQRHDISDEDGSLLAECIRWIENLEPGSKIRNYHNRRNTNNFIYFESTSKVCRIAKREHKGNHVYWGIRLGDTIATQYCRDEVCGARNGKQVELSDDLKKHMVLAKSFEMMVFELLRKK